MLLLLQGWFWRCSLLRAGVLLLLQGLVLTLARAEGKEALLLLLQGLVLTLLVLRARRLAAPAAGPGSGAARC